MDAVTSSTTSVDVATTLDLARLTAARHDVLAPRPGEPDGGGAWQGPFRGRRRGQGMEFDDLRPYADGDDVRHVDWRSSARRDTLQTRLYREEKEHVVTIALDLRGAMFTGSERLRAVTAGLLAARLLWRASAGGCRVGLAALDDDGIALSRAAGGERGALDACRLVADTFARARARAGDGSRVGTGGRPVADATSAPGGETSTHETRTASASPKDAEPATLASLLERLLRGGRRLGASVVVTGMDAPEGDLDAALARLATARPLAVVLVEDPLERRAPPTGRYRYRGADGPHDLALGGADRRRLDALLATRRERIERRLDAARVSLVAARDGDAQVLRALRDAGFLP